MAKACHQGSASRGFLSVFLLAGTLLWGCGGQGDEQNETPSPATEGTGAADATGGTATAEVTAPPDGRVIMTADGAGFHPSRIHTTAGRPITLSITRTTDETCATEIVIPGQQVRKDLPLKQAVEVTFTPTSTGEIAFACGMNMLKGTVVVE